VPKSIACETTIKMMREEVGICRRYVHHKKNVYLTRNALDINVRNLVHKQSLCTIQKNDKGIQCLILKRLHLLDISCGT
jgi:hypothetical protein